MAIAEILPAYAGLLLEQELELSAGCSRRRAPLRTRLRRREGRRQAARDRASGHARRRGSHRGKLAEQIRVSNPFDFPVRLPEDVVGVPRLQPDAESRVCSADDLPYGWAVLDIGPKTAAEFAEVIAGAATIFWNGPMGVFEWPRFAEGTDTVAEPSRRRTRSRSSGAPTRCTRSTVSGCSTRLLGIDRRRSGPRSSSPERSYPVLQSSLPSNPGALVVLRHGESAWNASGLFTGWVDVDLSAAGEAEAVRAGELLVQSGLLPDVVHTSVLRRAIRTTDLALAAAGRSWIPVRRSWRLNERHYGAFREGARSRRGSSSATSSSCSGAAPTTSRRLRSIQSPASPPLDPATRDLPPDALPATECLKDVLARSPVLV